METKRLFKFNTELYYTHKINCVFVLKVFSFIYGKTTFNL